MNKKKVVALHFEIPKAPKPPKTKKLRITVAMDEKGLWHAAGFAGKQIELDDAAIAGLPGESEGNVYFYSVEVEVPIPNFSKVKGKLQGQLKTTVPRQADEF